MAPKKNVPTKMASSEPKKRGRKPKVVEVEDTPMEDTETVITETALDTSTTVAESVIPPVQPTIQKVRKNKRKPPRVAKTASSYLLFSVEHRKELISNQPNLGLGEVSKLCGQRWRELSDDVKQEWKVKADALKAEALANAPPAPAKKPPSSYLLFAMTHRKQVLNDEPSLSLGDVSKRCGEAWKTLDDAEKQKWKDEALQLREK